jgi:hypothetical protein
MTDQHQHSATPKQWAAQQKWASPPDLDPYALCLLELRARIESLEAAPQDKLDRLIALDREDPTPDPAMTELRAASAEAQPAGGLVERVMDAIADSAAAYGAADEPACAAIREVAAWLSEHTDDDASAYWAERLEQEANRG